MQRFLRNILIVSGYLWTDLFVRDVISCASVGTFDIVTSYYFTFLLILLLNSQIKNKKYLTL